MRNNGLIIRHLWDQTEEHLEVRALSMEESCALSLAPEVIFICVKEYSLDSVLPFIRQTAGPRTIITVSYTHLDVYKRQVHIHFSKN